MSATPQVQLKPVVWKATKYSGYEARIGGTSIGSVNYTTTRNDPTPWYGHSRFTEARRGFVAEAEARVFVEASALAFVRHIARTPTPETP